MGYTVTEKILLAHTDKRSISPGDLIECKVDLCLGNDITAPIAISEFEKTGVDEVFDNKKIALVPDHFSPAKDIKSAEQLKILRDFARKYSIKYYYEIGCMGIEHALLPEEGLTVPGDLIIGADSHTCTYGAVGAFSTGVGSTDLAAVFIRGRIWFKVPESIKFIYSGKLNKWVGGKDLILYTIGDIGVGGALYKAMEFTGDAIERLPMDDRFAMCNMAIEAGGKNGIIAADETTLKYVKETAKKSKKKWKIYKSDKDAQYCEVKKYDVSKLEPMVSLPPLPSNAKPVSQVKNVRIDQSVIGSCTNGRISDLRMAAKVLKGKKVHKDVRCIIFPATQATYLQAMDEGLMEIFIKSGCAVSTPTCGPCLGGHMGILAAGERSIATTNRNFIGRMGHLKSEVYLSNPAVAAASAVKGRIAHPEEVI
ncbi:MAG: 3-isopropylmalate dehydratase large subunit [Omnitrophica WOR_2 bacterium RIFCSPLOWO2_12_FULL_51_24]|nr:MAG: 3-isopropylmalate dehydratase large subunit [Omnitrophica WOR_2 bacterium RIFCSPHIGHO2_01_FULL_49_10]OGX35515.1 MAG: 3-isopropylmalate dehydratase large subunit [Omnitrophica WOR_2 bacterium RIFCSPLOWO2_02_FULL_50_19]OGX43837.1 MAG: 3-isopropylmalate dehydratase large subunit [Omnitrophica WOR_2 bacterium RIFCSPLOWO2_12_FULL_51_24]